MLTEQEIFNPYFLIHFNFLKTYFARTKAVKEKKKISRMFFSIGDQIFQSMNASPKQMAIWLLNIGKRKLLWTMVHVNWISEV